MPRYAFAVLKAYISIPRAKGLASAKRSKASYESRGVRRRLLLQFALGR